MAYVSLLVPFVLAYIIYVWNAMDKIKITREEIANDDHAYIKYKSFQNIAI